MRLALGAAQFGLDYGILNAMGQVTGDEVVKILKRACQAGIDTIDTAIAYGESEQRLGRAGVDGWQVISKLPGIPEGCLDIPAWVVENVDASLERLRLQRLRGLLLHRPSQLLGPNGSQLYQSLLELKRAGKVEKIGVSIYEPCELDELSGRYAFDLIQSPFNVLDRRLATSGWLYRLHAEGIEVHVRSVFLQGLLIAVAAKCPSGFEQWQPVWDSWKKWVDETGSSPLQAALSHVFSYPEICRIVIGVDGLGQLNEILECTEKEQRAPELLSLADPNLLNPTCWPKFF
jgi:aryl-alcohol dehydrogenase-like predicted oxidoreductase